MNRRPVCLTNDFTQVNNHIIDSFTSVKGPGDFPVSSRKKLIKGIIAPNLDYKYSKYGMAWSYKEIAEAELPDVYVIVGSGIKEFNTYSFADWETALGIVKINKDFGNELVRKSSILKNNAEQYVENTSIELQLPYLQYVNKDFLNKVSFVPVLVGNESYDELLKLADLLSDINGKVCYIFSANLVYHGKEFNYVPYIYAVKENLTLVNEQLIDAICSLDSKKFYDLSRRKNVLDRNVVVVAIEIMRGLGLKKGRFLNYYESGEFCDYENSVGFCSIVFD